MNVAQQEGLILDALAGCEDGKTADELAEETGLPPEGLGPRLRLMAKRDMIREGGWRLSSAHAPRVVWKQGGVDNG